MSTKSTARDLLRLIQVVRFSISLGQTPAELLRELEELYDQEGNIEDYIDQLFDDLNEAQEALRADINA